MRALYRRCCGGLLRVWACWRACRPLHNFPESLPSALTSPDRGWPPGERGVGPSAACPRRHLRQAERGNTQCLIHFHCTCVLYCSFLENPALSRSAVSHGNGFSSAPAESSGDSSSSSSGDSSGSSNGTGGSSGSSTGSSSSSSSSSGGCEPAVQRLLALSQSHDTQQPGDPHFSKQLTPEKRLRVIAMLLQHGVTEATVAGMIVKRKGGPYVSSVSNGAAVLQELRARGCDDERLNRLLQRAPTVMSRPASNIMASFAALDDILQLSRSDVLRVCEEQPGLLSTDAGSLRWRWAKVQERYQLPPKVVRSLQKMMRYSWCTIGLLIYDYGTVE